jgi:predicted dinucleotide-binding enzyme
MAMQKVGIIGSGQVAKTLAAGFVKHGYTVMIGSRNTDKLEEWKTKTKLDVSIGSFEEAADFGQMLVLSVKGNGAEKLVQLLRPRLEGKTILDTTNPIADAPPENGVLKFFTDLNNSLMENLQRIAPDANFVKCFSCVGNALMVNPSMTEGKPSMFICGDSESAKSETKTLLEKFGWDVADMGKATAARAIEPLCMLWCIPGFLNNSWGHAFSFIRR